jgi:hypothetical protein
MYKFIEWLDLRESMDLYVSGFEYPQETETLLDLCHYLFRNVIDRFWQKMTPEQQARFRNQGRAIETISPDTSSSDAFGSTGIINFYMGGIDPALRPKMLQGVKYYLDELGVKYGPFKEESDGSDIRVVRIPILHNEPKKHDMPAKLNMANANAHLIFGQLLGFPDEGGSYSFSARDVMVKIDGALKELDIQKAARPTTVEKGKGATVYSMGLSADDIKMRLGKIREIAKWAIEKGYDQLYVA